MTNSSRRVAVDGVIVEEVIDGAPQPADGLGDRIERAIGKIPGVKKLPCYDKAGKLKPESGCAKRKKKLNELGQKLSGGKQN